MFQNKFIIVCKTLSRHLFDFSSFTEQAEKKLYLISYSDSSQFQFSNYITITIYDLDKAYLSLSYLCFLFCLRCVVFVFYWLRRSGRRKFFVYKQISNNLCFLQKIDFRFQCFEISLLGDIETYDTLRTPENDFAVRIINSNFS